MDITITTDGPNIAVSTPFDPAFPTRARALGGRWDGTSKTWRFSERDEARVRDLLRDIYGTDGADSDGTTVSVRVPIPGWRREQEFRAAGLRIVWRPGRDEDVRYAAGAVLISGGFPSSGGSVRNPRLEPADGTVVEVRDVSPGAAEKIVGEVPGAEIVDGADLLRDALVKERTRLVARIAEIDGLLGTAG